MRAEIAKKVVGFSEAQVRIVMRNSRVPLYIDIGQLNPEDRLKSLAAVYLAIDSAFSYDVRGIDHIIIRVKTRAVQEKPRNLE